MVLKYINYEYDNYVEKIMTNLETAIGTQDNKMEVAIRFAKETMMIEAKKRKKEWYRLDLK